MVHCPNDDQLETCEMKTVRYILCVFKTYEPPLFLRAFELHILAEENGWCVYGLYVQYLHNWV